jgi:3',5'-cyclic AMP phosphodiesterase CpdA
MLNFRFAIVSDLHVSVPHKIWDHPSRFHLVELSIPVLERVFEHLEALPLDFILLPGDLTQHGEPENHLWLQQRLSRLPFPAYVIPGNHDIPYLHPDDRAINIADFPKYYRKFGYQHSDRLYYTQEIVSGVQLIALNSNTFDDNGKQLGRLDREQCIWLESILPQLQDKLLLVAIHHNVIEHLPGQSQHELGQRYMLDNSQELLEILQKYGVKFIFTGHLHVQDIAEWKGIYEITTGSLVSYPHPYRVLEYSTNSLGEGELKIVSHRVESVSGWENLAEISREWMGDRSFPFMMRLLTAPPLNLPEAEAKEIAPHLRYFWAGIADGDAYFDFPDFPPLVRQYFRKFSAIDCQGNPRSIDNQTTIKVNFDRPLAAAKIDNLIRVK